MLHRQQNRNRTTRGRNSRRKGLPYHSLPVSDIYRYPIEDSPHRLAFLPDELQRTDRSWPRIQHRLPKVGSTTVQIIAVVGQRHAPSPHANSRSRKSSSHSIAALCVLPVRSAHNRPQRRRVSVGAAMTEPCRQRIRAATERRWTERSRCRLWPAGWLAGLDARRERYRSVTA